MSSQPQLPKITFYDILSTLPPKTPNGTRTWSPFTVRTLLALRYRNLPYTRVAVSYPDIAPLLSSKGVAPDKEDDNKYTLPAISLQGASPSDPETTMSESLDIARKLESLVPASAAHPSLFPRGEDDVELVARAEEVTGRARRGLWKFVVPHVPDNILDQRGAEYLIRTREASMGNLPRLKAEMSDEGLPGALEEAVRTYVTFYLEEGGRGDGGEGVFLGQRARPSYADFCVVAAVEWWRCARGDEVVNSALEKVEGGLLMKVVKGCEYLLY